MKTFRRSPQSAIARKHTAREASARGGEIKKSVIFALGSRGVDIFLYVQFKIYKF